jgi:hypothetical protein
MVKNLNTEQEYFFEHLERMPLLLPTQRTLVQEWILNLHKRILNLYRRR